MQKASLTLVCNSLNTVKVSPGNGRRDEQYVEHERQAMKHERERRAKAAELNHRANDFPRRVIPYEEYMTHREAGKNALTVAK